jgi:hypothetical protein
LVDLDLLEIGRLASRTWPLQPGQSIQIFSEGDPDGHCETHVRFEASEVLARAEGPCRAAAIVELLEVVRAQHRVKEVGE